MVVSGRVQGVGFRDYTLRCADQYEVLGEVWNRLDEWVEVIAQHPDPVVLDLFREQLLFGPGRVDSVSDEDYDPAPEYDGFRISFIV